MSGHDNAVPDPLAGALAELGSIPTLRDALLHVLRDAEREMAAPGRDVRAEVTGPVADAICRDAGELRLVLADGLIYDFAYTSRIARSIVLRAEPRPDHVWEPQTTRLLLHLADGARHVIVGGAYAGDQALLVARAIAAAGGVCHAFEPNPRQAERLRRNAATNGLDNLWVDERALWREDGVRLTLMGVDSDAHAVPLDGPPAAGEDAFIATTIDAYVEGAGLERVDLIMLDVEGAEQATLDGGQALLARDGPSIVFEVHREYVDWSRGLAETEIVHGLRERGYRVYAVRDFHATMPMGTRPIELIEPERTVVDGPPHGFNMVAVKDAARLDGSPFRVREDVSPKLLWHKDPALHHPG